MMSSDTPVTLTGHPVPVFRNTLHHSKSFETLNTMRQQHLLCDVIVKVGGREINGMESFQLVLGLGSLIKLLYRTAKY